jgi:hypothetical protein
VGREDPADLAQRTNPLAPSIATVPASDGAVEGELAIGDVVGRYQILGKLGAGGMGEVYAAMDPELRRKIAVKIVRHDPQHGDSEGAARLLKEAQASPTFQSAEVRLAVAEERWHRGDKAGTRQLLDDALRCPEGEDGALPAELHQTIEAARTAHR